MFDARCPSGQIHMAPKPVFAALSPDVRMIAKQVQVTREELYEEVWSQPTSLVAQKYGISDVGLAKICRRLNVPKPGRGYWARKSAGQKVRQIPLPKISPTAPKCLLETTIYGHTPARDGKPDEPEGPVADQRRFEAQPENRITVAELLNEPHSLVAKTVVALRGAKPDAQGLLQPRAKHCLDVNVTLNTADRAMSVMDALLKACDVRGYAVQVRTSEQRATVIRVRDEELTVTLNERLERADLPEPPKSKRTALTWRPRPQYQWLSTGRLSLTIGGGWTQAARRTWSDRKKHRLEDSLNDFIVGMVAVAEELKVQRAERERQEQEFRAAEERRRVEAQRRMEEQSRIRALNHAVVQWRDSYWVREFVNAMRAAAQGTEGLTPESPLGQWLDWADRYADAVDPTRPQPAIPEDPEPYKRFAHP